MKKVLFLIALSMGLCLFAGGQLRLAKDGKTDYKIVWAAREKLAADELKLHLDKITGADFTLVKEGEAVKGPAIYLGSTEFARKQGLDFSKFERQEWLVRNYGSDLVIGGGYPLGTLYGVYDFLENRLGCHWYSPETSEIPQNANLTVGKIEMRGKPSFETRELFDDYYSSWRLRPEVMEAKKRYKMRNRSSLNNGLMAVWKGNLTKQYFDCHNFYVFLNPKKYFAEHPEYFSMDANGRRFHGNLGPTMQGGAFCMTNPEVRNIVYKELSAFIRKDRTQLPKEDWPTVYDISSMDCCPFLCQCPECRKIINRESRGTLKKDWFEDILREGGDSGLLLDFINDMARRAAKDFPGVRIRTFAYVSTVRAPKHIRPEKNVLIRWCDLYAFSDPFKAITDPFNHRQREQFDEWVQLGAEMQVWDYWNMGGQFFDPPRVDTAVDAIAPTLRYFQRNRVTDYFGEITVREEESMQCFMRLETYLGYQLMLNVNQDPEKLIARFMKGYFGPAEKPMTEYLNLIRKGVKETRTQLISPVAPRAYCTKDLMKKSYDLLMAAHALTQEGSVYRYNVEQEMTTPLYVILKNQEWNFGNRKELTELYRKIRMCHIDLLRQDQKRFIDYRKEAIQKLQVTLNQFEMVRLPVPKGFEGKEIRLFGWPNLRWYSYTDKTAYVDDPDSAGGKALISYKPRSWQIDGGKYRRHDATEKQSGFWNSDFGIYDYGTKHSVAKSIPPEDIPQDEKYHWIHVGKYDVNAGSFVWGFGWEMQGDIGSAYIPADGKEGANIWDVWVSVKFTGPAYVDGSKKKNEIYWDQIMLVRPDAQKAE